MRILLALVLMLLVQAAFAVPVAELDALADEAIQRYALPGIAIGVIEEGKVSYRRTAGERVAGSDQPIDADTLFKIASNSKAMTASVLARLVDAKKLNWDDPVIRHLPAFRMHDPWVTQNMQVRDLLVHNSGLPEGGGDLMLWPEPNHFTRADILAGLAHIKPKYGFRAGYAYDNLLYVVAGEVAAAAGGASYEELVRREVFAPLGLDCKVGAWQRAQDDNLAQPHSRIDGRNVVVKPDAANIAELSSAAAGGIRCSLDAMLSWAGNWLDPDAKQKTWLSAEQRSTVWSAHTPMPISQRRRDWDNTHAYLYALGWRLADVDGEWTVSHTGTLSGMYSVLMLLPDRKSGFVVLINGEAEEARTVLTEALLKRFTRAQDTRGLADFAADLARDRSAAPAVPDVLPDPLEVVAPQQAANLLGVWRDPWFGEITICPERSQVRWRSLKSPKLSGILKRAGDRALIDWDEDHALAWLHPGNASDRVLRMSKVDVEADFSYDYEDLAFTRLNDCE
jgi:CubicO group peptidase (beta-lactamase class C family)